MEIEERVFHLAPARPAPGYVYLVLSTTSGLHKIGSTRQIGGRFRSLESAHSAEVLRFVHSFPCASMQETERALHARYASKRVRGEWFALNDEDVRFVKIIRQVRAEREIQAPNMQVSLISGRGVDDIEQAYQLGLERADFRLVCNRCESPAKLEVCRDWFYFGEPFELGWFVTCSRCQCTDVCFVNPSTEIVN